MDKELWNLYLRVIHSGGIGDIEAWTKLELTMPQLKVLMLLSHYGEMTIGHLAEMLNVSLPNMTGIIDRLTNHELVKREQSEKDKRVYHIVLTEKANHLFEELNQSGFNKFKNIGQQLSDTELEIVKLGLKVLVKAIDKAQEES